MAVNGGRAFAGVDGNTNEGNMATADGARSNAIAGSIGFGNKDNSASATNEGIAQAGSQGDNNNDNTAIADGPGSLANAGSLGDDNDGYTATAGPGEIVTVP